MKAGTEFFISVSRTQYTVWHTVGTQQCVELIDTTRKIDHINIYQTLYFDENDMFSSQEHIEHSQQWSIY